MDSLASNQSRPPAYKSLAATGSLLLGPLVTFGKQPA